MEIRTDRGTNAQRGRKGQVTQPETCQGSSDRKPLAENSLALQDLEALLNASPHIRNAADAADRPQRQLQGLILHV